MDRSRAEPSRAAAKTSAGSQNTRDGCSSPYERGVSVWLPRRKHDLPPPRAPSFMPERTLPVCVFLSPDVKHCCLLEPTTAKLCERHTHMRTHNHTLTHTHTHHRYNNSSGGGADSPLSVTWPGSAPSVVLATMKTLTRMRITARFFCSSSLLGDRRRHVDSSLKTQDNSPCHSDRGANVVVN